MSTFTASNKPITSQSVLLVPELCDKMPRLCFSPHAVLHQDRQESRCSLILASGTLTWHTGQLTVRLVEAPPLAWATGVEVEGAGPGAGRTNLEAPPCLPSLEVVVDDEEEEDEDSPTAFRKKSKMSAEVRLSRGLFLELMSPDWLVGSLV